METLLRAPNGGDVASFSPTGLGVANGHDVLQRGFYEAAFQRRAALGHGRVGGQG